MTDQNQAAPKQDPLWLRVVHDQHFKLAVTYLIKTSGISSMAAVQKWFPGLTPDTLTLYIIYAAPFVVTFVIDWWRNNPNNLIRRTLLVLNGPKVSDESKAALTAAVSTAVPGVSVTANPTSASAAVVEMAKSQDNNVKLERAP